jgi:Fe-S-cluster containining protein
MNQQAMQTKENDFNYPKNVRFRCARCTLCCGDAGKRTRHIVMTQTEAKTISETNNQPITDFAHKIDGHEPYVHEMQKDRYGKCVFLNKDSCTIYSLRPLVCRFYPFELKSEAKGEYLFSYTDECPGIGKGKVLTRKKFVDLMKEAQNRFDRNPDNH